jgi:TolA-binding protein
MNGRVLLAVSFLALGLTGCKTQEQVRREQMIDSMAHQVGQGQRTNAELNMRMQDIEKRLSGINGEIEEVRHESGSVVKEELGKLRADLAAMDQADKARDKEMEELRATVKEQRQFLDQVVASLAQISSGKKPKQDSKDAPADKKLGAFDQAQKDFADNNFAEARSGMLKLLENKKLKGNERAKLLHNLGMIEYLEKNYDSALVYFSRLFTEHPGSSLNSSGLLHLGLAFKNLKKNEEAKQTLGELIGRYPKSKHASTAKGVLKKM